MARDDPQFNLRMTQDLKEKISLRAKDNGRSLNAEIVQILQDAIDASEGRVRTGDREADREVQEMLVKLRRHTSEQDMLLNDFVQILNKKPT